MTTQELLIDEINWLKALIEKCEPGQMRMDIQARLEAKHNELNTVNATVNNPKCPAGYSWDNVLQACVFNG